MAGVDNPKSKVKYVEFWGGNGEWVVWKFGRYILEKKKNPNFDYGDMGGNNGQTFNLFKKPRKPYLTLSVFNLGKTVYDYCSLDEQGKTIKIISIARNATFLIMPMITVSLFSRLMLWRKRWPRLTLERLMRNSLLRLEQMLLKGYSVFRPNKWLIMVLKI